MLSKSIKFMLMAALVVVLLVAMPVAAQSSNAGTTLSGPEPTANGYWIRTLAYDWTILKTASTASVDLASGSAVVGYTIEVTRTLASDTQVAGVYGEICTTNGGERATDGLQITLVVETKVGSGQFQDYVSGVVDVSSNPVLDPGETGCYSYDVQFAPVAGATYRAKAQVGIMNHSGSVGELWTYEPKTTFSLPSAPTIVEIDATAVVTDVLHCPAGFSCVVSDAGPWTFLASGSVSYEVTVTDVGALCAYTYDLHNIATLVASNGETHSDDAHVAMTTGPCPAAGEGCTPGYWKNHEGAWAPAGYSPSQSVSSVFANAAPFEQASLLDALGFGGGKGVNGAKQILLRAAVAALLDASHPDVNYPRSAADVISLVSAALGSGDRATILDLAASLDADNNLGCPL